jgi:small subunit ribosomal protein S15
MRNKDRKVIMSQIDKAAIRKQFQRHERDTGSSEVQIASLTKEIEHLTEHMKINKKDHSSRYGLIRKVNTRRSLLDYLKRTEETIYQKIVKNLGLRR